MIEICRCEYLSCIAKSLR
jgi:hypothetical protein